jgi:two-component system copper resistance phosphate regulon response regulator CusR
MLSPESNCDSSEENLALRILLVEDEPAAAQMLAQGLREHGYAVDLAADGEEGLEKIYINQYDLVILDVVLPRKDGLAVCRELRSAGNSIPVFMLTARDGVEDRITGLNLGADDYLTKPYEYREVLARVHALLRRGPTTYYDVIEVGDLRIELKGRTVARAGRPIELTAKEYAILEYMARRQGQVLTREDLSEHAWDEHYDVFSNVIEVYMLRLRKKIDAGHEVRLLRTRRGEGYVLTAEDCRHV